MRSKRFQLVLLFITAILIAVVFLTIRSLSQNSFLSVTDNHPSLVVEKMNDTSFEEELQQLLDNRYSIANLSNIKVEVLDTPQNAEFYWEDESKNKSLYTSYSLEADNSSLSIKLHLDSEVLKNNNFDNKKTTYLIESMILQATSRVISRKTGEAEANVLKSISETLSQRGVLVRVEN